MVGSALSEAGGAKDLASMPSTTSWMKQLPASSWEHMGLVMGLGVSNYQKQIETNTASIAKDIKTVANHIMGIGKGPGNHPWGLSQIGNAP